MASIKILSGSLAGQELPLVPEATVVGRASTNQIVIADAGVSSKHAKIAFEANAWWVVDLGSTNGTLVNNADVERQQLKNGDKIAFGPVVVQFMAGPAAPVIAPPPPPRAAAPPRPQAPVVDSGQVAALETELASLRSRFSALEADSERMRAEFVEREKFVADQAVASMKGELQKLRDLMRERDDSMRSLEQRIQERESFYSPEEVERERKRIEAAVQLEAKRQAEAGDKRVKELEAKLAERSAEVEASARTIREKDDLIKLVSGREDRAGGLLKEQEDKLSAVADQLRRLQDEVAAAGAREREANERLKQKNAQLAELGQQQAALHQDLSKARAAAARVGAGDQAAANEQLQALTAGLEAEKARAAELQASLAAAREEAIGASGRIDQAESLAKAAQAALDESQATLTDLNDDKARLEKQVNDLLEKHARMAEVERQSVGAIAKIEKLEETTAELRRILGLAEDDVAQLRQERIDVLAARDEAEKRLRELQADYDVLQQSRDATFDWEARYKSQVEDFETLRRQNAELRQTAEALQAHASLNQAGGVDESLLHYARARTTMLEQATLGMVEGVNSAVSLLRRNSEVLKGYVHDCGLLANCVRQIDYTRLEPEQQRMLRELIDETQPDVIIRNMESIGDENADATKRAKALLLDYLDALKVDEEGAELERCFEKSRGLVGAIEGGSPVKVKFGSAAPPLAASQPEGVLFTFALLREARAAAVDEDQPPSIRVDAQGTAITVMVSPVHARLKDRFHETAQGGGDARSRYLLGFARQAQGRVDVKDVGEAAAIFITLQGAN